MIYSLLHDLRLFKESLPLYYFSFTAQFVPLKLQIMFDEEIKHKPDFLESLKGKIGGLKWKIWVDLSESTAVQSDPFFKNKIKDYSP